jgi:hypothetical protein
MKPARAPANARPDRSANQTIRGYAYQFDLTTLAILRATDDVEPGLST